MTLGQTTPLLRIFDEAAARAFYLDWLGFSVVFEHRVDAAAPLYMGIARDGCVLHLTGHHGDCCPGAQVRIAADDVDALLAELQSRPYGGYRPSVEAMLWGTRDMAVTDPFGNRLTFSSPGDAPAAAAT